MTPSPTLTHAKGSILTDSNRDGAGPKGGAPPAASVPVGVMVVFQEIPVIFGFLEVLSHGAAEQVENAVDLGIAEPRYQNAHEVVVREFLQVVHERLLIDVPREPEGDHPIIGLHEVMAVLCW